MNKVRVWTDNLRKSSVGVAKIIEFLNCDKITMFALPYTYDFYIKTSSEVEN